MLMPLFLQALTTIMSPAMYELLAVSVGREQPTPSFLVRASLYLKCQFASTVLFWACLWSVKASFLAFFHRLTEHLAWPRRAWWAIVAVTMLAFITSVITYPISCTSFTLGKSVLLHTKGHADFSRRLSGSRECLEVFDQPSSKHCSRHLNRHL